MRTHTPTGIDLQRTVIIADDEPSMRLLVRATIDSDDYMVLEAANGQEAWDLICEQDPALILLDVQMPGMSGLEVLKLVKNDPARSHAKVILLTSKAQERDIEVGLLAGADFYLTKPFSPLDLLTRVEEALEL